MDFDEMFEAWRGQNTAPPYDVNREALRQALRDEGAKVQREMRTRRRGLWVCWIFGTAMATWAGFWIAITITNGWPMIYAFASGGCLALFALGAGALWMTRGRELDRDFGNTLQDEVKRNLALIDNQLSVTKRWIPSMLGTLSIVAGALLFSWIVNRSQDIPDSSGGGWWTVVLVVFFAWATYKGRIEIKKARAKLQLRQQRLRELLASLEVREDRNR